MVLCRSRGWSGATTLASPPGVSRVDEKSTAASLCAARRGALLLSEHVTLSVYLPPHERL